MKAICWGCTQYVRQEPVGEYTFRCSKCGAENDKNDLHHSATTGEAWCGKNSCPKCQGHNEGPYD